MVFTEKNESQNLHTYGIASHKMGKHTLSKIDLKELHCLLAFPYTVHTKLKILHSQRQYSIGTEWSWHSVYYTIVQTWAHATTGAIADN